MLLRDSKTKDRMISGTVDAFQSKKIKCMVVNKRDNYKSEIHSGNVTIK